MALADTSGQARRRFQYLPDRFEQTRLGLGYRAGTVCLTRVSGMTGVMMPFCGVSGGRIWVGGWVEWVVINMAKCSARYTKTSHAHTHTIHTPIMPHSPTPPPPSPSYLCYVIANSTFTRTYAGSTNNLTRRLRQHNGELVGGAKATRGFAPCQLLFVVRGFGPDQRAALRVEWRLKTHGRRGKGRSQGRRLSGHPLVRRQELLGQALEWARAHLGVMGEGLEVVYGLPCSVTSD